MEKIFETQDIVSSLYIDIPYLVKWIFVNFSKSGILRHKSEYFFCASDFSCFFLAFLIRFFVVYIYLSETPIYALYEVYKTNKFGIVQ